MKQFIADLLRQRAYLRRYLVPELERLQHTHHETFDPYLQKKIIQYYGLLTTGVLAENYARLHSRRLSPEERRLSTWLGAMTPLFDDFFDRSPLSDEQIRQMMASPFTFAPAGLEQAAILYFHGQLLRELKDGTLFTLLIQKVFQSQIDSRMQSSASVTDEALWKITYNKAGYSLLTYRCVLDIPVLEGEQEVLYQLGGILQLCNDVFDVHKDLEEGIITLPLRCRDFSGFKQTYLDETRAWMEKTRRLPVAEKDIERFIAFMLIVICRGVVALDQLIALQRTKGEGFDLRSCTRAELICDMAKPANFLKSLITASKLGKK